ncbi:hypothetical protein [Paenibacillus odorifer]|uniref:hypothetical protein n=1 Tax=Paenibacillus odorifer TaxID=189426 RepID=UPI00158C66A5|nr:hypothetical protein [Paenibacillus odorifer]
MLVMLTMLIVMLDDVDVDDVGDVGDVGDVDVNPSETESKSASQNTKQRLSHIGENRCFVVFL